jgi:hypothetical protein
MDLEEAQETKKSEEPMTLEEITRRRWGRWVAIRVVERDEAGQPKKGIVIYHTQDPYRLRKTIKEEESACIFYAGPTPKRGAVLI